MLGGNDAGWDSAGIVTALTGSAVTLTAFLLIERIRAAPMLPLGLFRNRAFTGAQIAAFAISASFFALFLYLTLYLQDVLRLSPVETGLVYLPATVTLFFASAATARLLRRVTAGVLVAGGLALVAAGLALTVLGGAHSSWTVLLPSLVLNGLGTGLFNPAVSAVALGSAPAEHSGLAAGVNDTFRHAGIAVGVAAFGALIPSAGTPGHGSVQSFVTGFHHAVLAAVLLAATGAALSAWLIGVRMREPITAPSPVSLEHV